jgi:hypothetical protein
MHQAADIFAGPRGRTPTGEEVAAFSRSADDLARAVQEEVLSTMHCPRLLLAA